MELDEYATLYSVGMMEEDTFVNDFCYYAHLNGKLLEKQCEERGDVVYKYDIYDFEFTSYVPPYVPAGDWKIYLKLHDADDVCIACIQATYQV